MRPHVKTKILKTGFRWDQFCFGTLCGCLILYMVTFVIDPLGFNYLVQINRINKVKPVAPRFARELKMYRMKKVNPATIILGSSRAAWGIDPLKIEGFPEPVFNAAMEYGQPYEMKQTLEYAVENTQVKEVVLLLDYFTFANKGGVEGHSLSISKVAFIEKIKRHLLAYFSANAFLGNFETIARNVFGAHLLGTTETGFIVNTSKKRFVDRKSESDMAALRREAIVTLDHRIGVKIVKEIKQICQKNNIQLHTILGPIVPEHIQMRKELGTWSQILEWKKDLSQLVDYYDYFNENQPFQEQHFFDHMHFTPEVGVYMLNSIKNKELSFATKAVYE